MIGPDVKDRRTRPRQPASLMVRYSSESLALTGVATDLSPTGLFVESDLLDMEDTEATLQLCDGTWRWMGAVGQVVRTVADPKSGQPGMGMRFVELGAGTQEWIEGYCRAFSTSCRVVVADGDRRRLLHASQAVTAAGARPLCLSPEVLSKDALSRLEPHAVIVGDGLGTRGSIDLIHAVRDDGLLFSASLFLAGDVHNDVRASAADVGADVISWDDHTAVERVVNEACHRFNHESTPRGRDWVH